MRKLPVVLLAVFTILASSGISQVSRSSTQHALVAVAAAQIVSSSVPKAPWNPKYGRLTSADVQRMDQTGITFDLNYFRLHPETLDHKEVMQYFIGLNNCGNAEIERATFNELDYPALAAYYKAKASEILEPLPRSIPNVAVDRFVGGGQANGWRMWSKSLTLGEYNTQTKAFPIKYPGKNDVELPDTLNVEAKRDLSKTCSIAAKAFSAAGRYLPSSYSISITPTVYKELPMDEAAARKYIDSAGQQRSVFLAVDAKLLDTPPTISNSNQVTFHGQTARVRVIDAKTLQSLGPLYDDHSVTDTQVAQQAPPAPAPAPEKRGSQWAASDHLYEIRQAVYVSLAADACPDWPISAEQGANLKSFLERAKNGKFNDREQYYTTDTVVRNSIARQGRMNYCANARERRDFDKAAATVAPLGPIAAPESK